jgi:S-adenosylmethionine-diacylglycerol 3-amino-3-carboxypropyl transferase
MSASHVIETPRARAKQLLKSAVHQSRAFSVDGVLERVFAYGFNGLVYSQIWEDPVVDMEAMELQPHHHVVAISSGGCNVLSYLMASPARITAVDLSPAHVALVKLKLAGLRELPDWQSFYRFFGEASSRENLADYDIHLRDHLDESTRKYWEGRMPNGRKRLSRFASNIYRKGLLGRFIGAGHTLARMGGAKLDGILFCESMAQQRQFFDKQIAPLFEKPIVRRLCGYRAALFGLGIPPSQYDALAGNINMADVLRARLEKLACDFPIAENYFAWQAFGRGYAPNAAGPLPLYLQKENFSVLRKRTDRVKMLHASMTDTLANMKPASVDRVVLLDAQDWMSDIQLNELWSAICHVAKPGARVIFRTAGMEPGLEGHVAAPLLNQWNYLQEKSATLGKKDRSSIYGGFHVYERQA